LTGVRWEFAAKKSHQPLTVAVAVDGFEQSPKG